MNRRDCLKLGLATIAGVLGFQLERITMLDRNLATKLATNQTLSPGEIELLWRTLNTAEQNAAFIAGLHGGSSNVNVNRIKARSAELSLPPNNGSFFGPQYEVLPNPTVFMQNVPPGSGYVVINSFQQEVITPQSFVVWHNKAAGKFKVSPNFENIKDAILGIAGNITSFTYSGGAYYQELVVGWYTRSGNVYKYSVPLDSRNAVQIGGGGAYAVTASFSQFFNLAQLDSIGDLYFRFEYMDNCAGTVSLDLTAMFSRAM
jgi:hypothetical protein